MAKKAKNPHIGKNIRRIRLAKKMSIRGICEKMNPSLSPVRLLAHELGRSDATVETLQRYAKALDVPIEKLLEKP